MRPGHFAPDIPHQPVGRSREAAASMRPGHFAPDITAARTSSCPRSAGFNEAGAFCPGYYDGRPTGDHREQASMRPGHFAPDIRARDLHARRRGRRASMRPGHFAPDIYGAGDPPIPAFACFNEAGAFCPGYSFTTPISEVTVMGFNEAGAFCPGYYRPGPGWPDRWR